MQPVAAISQQIWDMKYRFKAADGSPIDLAFDDTWRRVARAVALAEPEADRQGWLGYGDGDEATVVSYGPNPAAKYITTYFRKTFTIADANAYAGYAMRIKRDDGVVVYVNGTEVLRQNFNDGSIGYTTVAYHSGSHYGRRADPGADPPPIAIRFGQ